MWKLEAFGLKTGTFPSLLVLASYPFRILCRIYYGLLAGMWHLNHSSISSALPTQKVNMNLVVNLKTMQQPTILVTFFKSEIIVIGL